MGDIVEQTINACKYLYVLRSKNLLRSESQISGLTLDSDECPEHLISLSTRSAICLKRFTSVWEFKPRTVRHIRPFCPSFVVVRPVLHSS